MDTPAPSGALPEAHPLYAPGLKWRARAGGNVPYWVPPAKDIKAGYLPKSLALEQDASAVDIAASCQKQWKDLEAWRANRGQIRPTRYTIGWLIDRYLSDPTSPFHKLKADTQHSYRWECKRIRETIGERRLDPKVDGSMVMPRIVGEDIRRWHHNWGHPVDRAPTPSRARHCMAMFRTLASYNVEIGTPGASDLRERLGAMRFEGSTARTKAPTFEQVDALADMAVAMGHRSIAIATLAQYELIERRKHIIGNWEGRGENRFWKPGWEWSGVSTDWWIKYYQTKKARTLREYDLKTTQRLMGLMQETPKDARIGAIIICEATGQPWELRRYQETFREVARAAGVPDDVWSMDMRAGGATEADGVEGVTDRMFDDAGGWADPKMKNRYRRNKQRNAQNVVELRQAARNKP